MNVRPYTAQDKPLVDAWCRAWEKRPIPDWYLPTHGFVAEEDGKPVCVAWLYLTDSRVCYMENVVGDRAAPHEKRAEAVGCLGDRVFAEAKKLGYKVCIGWTSNKSVAEVSASRGMCVTDSKYATLIKRLDGA